jgi:hypothetical protein
MKCLVRCVFSFVLLSLTLGVSLGQMPPNAYLNKPARTVAELVKQVKADPVVRDNYCRHFSMEPEELYAFLSKLEVGRVEENGNYTVYGVPKSGAIHATSRKLKKGTKVFRHKGGGAVILAECGNPMTLGPKRPFSEAKIEAQPSGEVEKEPVPMPVEMPTAAKGDLMAEMAPPGLTPLPTVAETPPVVTGGESPIPIIAPVLGILPALFLVTNTGGEAPTPVPEPTTLTALGLGALWLAHRARRGGARQKREE